MAKRKCYLLCKKQTLVTEILLERDLTCALFTHDGKDRLCGAASSKKSKRKVIYSLIFWCPPYFSVKFCACLTSSPLPPPLTSSWSILLVLKPEAPPIPHPQDRGGNIPPLGTLSPLVGTLISVQMLHLYSCLGHLLRKVLLPSRLNTEDRDNLKHKHKSSPASGS